ncbi:MAG: acetyltransferase, partial [Oscillospiraceae bacterium]
HISPNAALAGTVTIGDKCHVGIGAVVKNSVTICENCIIGAGGVVVKDALKSGVYIGVPAKRREL